MLYKPTTVAVAADQLEKLKNHFSSAGSSSSSSSPSSKKKNLSIKIQIKSKHGHPMPEPHTLLLTQGQIAGIGRVRANGKRRFKTISMSGQQVAKNVSHHGGILGFLASLASRVLPALAKGAAAGLLSGALEQMSSSSSPSEKSGEGLYLFKRGHCIKVDPVKGNGLYLRSYPSRSGDMGDGLYLKRGGSMQTIGTSGDGLILGKSSPFKNIPILGWIL